MTPDLDLFRKIARVDFATNYSTGGFTYPPRFAWYSDCNPKKIEYRIAEALNASNFHFAIYAHFPFCASRCTFCRFYSLANNNPADYYKILDCMTKELTIWAGIIHQSRKIKGKIPLESIYLGGGTPTLFNLEKFFGALTKKFDISRCRQINLESTPDALNEKKLRFYKKIGVNRLLIGIQSLDPKVLMAVNRFSRQIDVLKKNYNLARKIGLPMITFELIAGLPKQTVKSFMHDLAKLIKLRPDGIHIYRFMLSPLSMLGKAGYYLDTEARLNCRKMFLAAEKLLEEAEYIESGDEWILREKESARNFQLVSGRPNLIPIGPSASGSIKTKSYTFYFSNLLDIKRYKERILKNNLAIDKHFILKGEEELIRRRFIDLMRLSEIDYSSTDYRYLKNEFKFLESRRIIKIEDSCLRIIKRDSRLWPKIFYSPKILKRCEKIIKKRYSSFL